jgi:hypothetical protein
MRDLSGYKPEKPSSGGFEAFKYDGPATIEKAVISNYDGEGNEFYALGDQQIEIEATVVDPDSEFLGRKLWKRFNLDSEKEDKKGKTAAMKLADQLFAVGLTFKNEEELGQCCEKLVGTDVVIKAWPVDFKDGRDKVQMWNIKGLAAEVKSKPSGSVAF